MTNVSDVLIIGGGIAGLRAALTASKFANVTVLTKGKIGETATEKAQGGIAAAIDKISDSTEFHFQDTIAAGAGLCDEKAVRILVNEGVERVRELIELGAEFDRAETEAGGYALALEGAHKRRRILHAGDQTGLEIEKTLAAQVMKGGKIKVFTQVLGIDIIINNGKCIGARALDLKTNKIEDFFANAVILTTGGFCQVYLHTTNPILATGDGVLMAYRSGAEVQDMEFVQFHPTSLVQFKEFEDIVALPQFLISEAVRGEGGLLLNNKSERFISELLPRDIVARAIFNEMKKTGSDHVFLQLSQIGADKIKKRFPGIYKTCLDRGLDITKDNIPVAPAAHYAMGGIKTDVDGKTNIDGLYAAGECSSLGVHGANRLASNSLLDGLVFGHRAAEASKAHLGGIIKLAALPEITVKEMIKPVELQRFKLIVKSNMWQEVGIERNEEGLNAAMVRFQNIEKHMAKDVHVKDEVEIKNLVQIALLVSTAAKDRKESRGAHFRSDHPETDDKECKKHLVYKVSL